MADYEHADDGKLHTRYSELVRCTPGQIEKVAAEHVGASSRFEGQMMQWGTDRHEMFADEVYRTSLIPEIFRDELDLPHYDIMMVEKQEALELWPGIVIHWTADSVAVAQQTIFDYKTALIDVDAPLDPQLKKIRQKYTSSRQLPIYAFLYGLKGIRIKAGVYLIEVWKAKKVTQRSGREVLQSTGEICCYLQINLDYKLSDLAKVLPWIEERVVLLQAALETRTE